jgi:2-(3-amino-3-carboxypropyl)histidine synthase
MYDLETEKIIKEIKKKKAKLVCLQLPDGLKPKAEELQKLIEEKTTAQVIIWGGSCFGSCDLPLEVKNLGVDLLIHFGHGAWQDYGDRGNAKIEDGIYQNK